MDRAPRAAHHRTPAASSRFNNFDLRLAADDGPVLRASCLL